MKLGVTLAFDAQNAAGGIRGRQIVLDFRDDQYEPDLAEQAARSLVNVQATQDGLRGARRRTTPPSPARPACPRRRSTADKTPSSRSSATWARRRWCAPRRCHSRRARSSSAPSRARPRSCATRPPAPARSTYSTCARAMPTRRARRSSTSFSRTCPTTTHLMSFDQNDSFGQAGYGGLVAAYTAIKGGFPASADRPIRSPASATRATTRRASRRRCRARPRTWRSCSPRTPRRTRSAS